MFSQFLLVFLYNSFIGSTNLEVGIFPAVNMKSNAALKIFLIGAPISFLYGLFSMIQADDQWDRIGAAVIGLFGGMLYGWWMYSVTKEKKQFLFHSTTTANQIPIFDQRIFRKPPSKFGYFLIPLVIVIELISFGFSSKFLLVSSVFIVLIVFGFVFGRQNYIVVSGEDITFHLWGLSMKAQWSDLIAMESTRIVSGWLVFSKTETTATRFRQDLLDIFEQNHKIPISVYSPDWRDNEIGEIIRSYGKFETI